jgi:hypothetical protein
MMKPVGLILSLLLLAPFAQAEEQNSDQWMFYPSIGLGWNQLEFVRPGGVLEADYLTLNLGLSATNGSMYVSLEGELFGKSNFQNGTDFTSVEREDLTLAVGGTFGQFSVFGGYTDAETKDDFLGEFHFDKGLFVGLGYDIPISGSSLGLSIAYADLDGEIYEDEVGLIETGDTTGFSYRISYSGAFRSDMGYKVFLRFRSYEFESATAVTDKDILSLGASIIF